MRYDVPRGKNFEETNREERERVARSEAERARRDPADPGFIQERQRDIRREERFAESPGEPRRFVTESQREVRREERYESGRDIPRGYREEAPSQARRHEMPAAHEPLFDERREAEESRARQTWAPPLAAAPPVARQPQITTAPPVRAAPIYSPQADVAAADRLDADVRRDHAYHDFLAGRRQRRYATSGLLVLGVGILGALWLFNGALRSEVTGIALNADSVLGAAIVTLIIGVGLAWASYAGNLAGLALGWIFALIAFVTTLQSMTNLGVVSTSSQALIGVLALVSLGAMMATGLGIASWLGDRAQQRILGMTMRRTGGRVA